MCIIQEYLQKIITSYGIKTEHKYFMGVLYQMYYTPYGYGYTIILSSQVVGNISTNISYNNIHYHIHTHGIIPTLTYCYRV